MNVTRVNPEMDKRPATTGVRGGAAGRLTIDELDNRILRLLLLDGRMSSRRVASELKVSTSTVTARVARLEKARVVKGYSAFLEYQDLGFELSVVTEVSAAKGRLAEMEAEVAKMPGVCAVYDVTGELDAVIVAKFRNRQELSHFTKELLSMPTVERTNSHVVLSTVKEDFRLPI